MQIENENHKHLGCSSIIVIISYKQTVRIRLSDSEKI